MARNCTVCVHPQRASIDQALIDGVRYRNITERFSVAAASLSRHRENHLASTLAQAREARDAELGGALLDQVSGIRDRLHRLLIEAEACGDRKTFLSAAREMRGYLELLGKLEGELRDGPVINIAVSPEWARTRAVIVEALGPHPEARQAVAIALQQIDGDRHVSG